MAMIPIPESVTISRKKVREEELYDKARTWLTNEERTPGLHASDMLDPMQAYWSKIDPRPLNDRLVAMFLTGKVLHAFVLGSYNDHVDLAVTDSGSDSSDLGFSYSPDLVRDGMVREFKTSRSFYEPKELKDVDHYVEQLLCYMAATNTTESELWVLFLNLKDDLGRTTPSFRCYTLRIGKDDLVHTQEFLRVRAGQLAQAVEARNPSDLELCREWKCGARNCDWYDQCQPAGRYGTDRFDSTGVKRAKKTSAQTVRGS